MEEKEREREREREMTVMEGQWKQFDLATQDAVSLATDGQWLKLGDFCVCQSLHQLQIIQKPGDSGHLQCTFSGPQIAQELHS